VYQNDLKYQKQNINLKQKNKKKLIFFKSTFETKNKQELTKVENYNPLMNFFY